MVNILHYNSTICEIAIIALEILVADLFRALWWYVVTYDKFYFLSEKLVATTEELNAATQSTNDDAHTRNRTAGVKFQARCRIPPVSTI